MTTEEASATAKELTAAGYPMTVDEVFAGRSMPAGAMEAVLEIQRRRWESERKRARIEWQEVFVGDGREARAERDPGR